MIAAELIEAALAGDASVADYARTQSIVESVTAADVVALVRYVIDPRFNLEGAARNYAAMREALSALAVANERARVSAHAPINAAQASERNYKATP